MYCDCDCHTTGAIHIDACCAGECKGCLRFIAFGHMEAHQYDCEEWFQWAKKLKRRELKRLKIYDRFMVIEGIRNGEL